MRALSVSLLVTGALFGAACQWLVPLEATTELAQDAAVVAPDAADDTGRGAAPSACDDPSTIQPPSSGPAAERNVDLALSFVTFNPGDVDPGSDLDLCPSPGFDLDRHTTCYDDAGQRKAASDCPDPTGVSCSWGPSCIRKGEAYCDREHGEDVAVGELITQGVKAAPKEISGALDLARVFRRGEGNVLTRVIGYNEAADDPKVAVAFFRSSGLARDSQPLPEAGADAASLVWDGRSRREWMLDPFTLAPGGTAPAFPPANGFVRNHVLVVTAGETILPGALDVTVHDIVLTAELRRTSDGGWALARGRLGGRLASRDIMRALLLIPMRDSNQQLKKYCDDPLGPSVVRQFVCPYVDLGREGGPCTDVSFGISFTAVPAIFGGMRAVSGVGEECPNVLECE